jgi:hypothetical protein
VDRRVSEVAEGALRRLSGAPAGFGAADAATRELRIGSITLAQLSRLAYLQAGDPLVDQVLAMLKSGRPVFLDRPAVEASIRASEYPPRVQEQFQKWFTRIASFGVALTGAELHTREASPVFSPPPPLSPEVKVLPSLTPDRQILSAILGEAVPESHPCWLEPGKACCGSGRCKTLGF